MIVYDRLWDTMKKKNISQYDLIHKHNVSSSLLDRLRHNKGVSTHTIDVLCNILGCKVEEIMEHSPAED